MQLILAQEVGQDADAGVGIDDGGMLGHDAIVEKVMQAEPVHIAHEEILQACVWGFGGWNLAGRQPLFYPLAHAARGAVSKGETGHVGKCHPLLMGVNDALGQHSRLAATRRSQHQMVASRSLDDTPLLGIE